MNLDEILARAEPAPEKEEGEDFLNAFKVASFTTKDSEDGEAGDDNFWESTIPEGERAGETPEVRFLIRLAFVVGPSDWLGLLVQLIYLPPRRKKDVKYNEIDKEDEGSGRSTRKKRKSSTANAGDEPTPKRAKTSRGKAAASSEDGEEVLAPVKRSRGRRPAAETKASPEPSEPLSGDGAGDEMDEDRDEPDASENESSTKAEKEKEKPNEPESTVVEENNGMATEETQPQPTQPPQAE